MSIKTNKHGIEAIVNTAFKKKIDNFLQINLFLLFCDLTASTLDVCCLVLTNNKVDII